MRVEYYNEAYNIPEYYLTERLKFFGRFASRTKSIIFWNGIDLLVAMSTKYNGYYAIHLDYEKEGLALMIQLLPPKGYYHTRYCNGISMLGIADEEISLKAVTRKFESDKESMADRYVLREGYEKKVAIENIKTITNNRLTTNRLLPLYGEPFETVDIYPNHAELRNRKRDILLMIGYRDKVVRGRKKRPSNIPITTLERVKEEST